MAIPGYEYDRVTYPGMSRTSAGIGGSAPQQTFTGYTKAIYEQLFKSPRESALLLDKTFRAAYGAVPIGTVMAEDFNTGNLVPYTPDTISKDDPSRVFLLTDLTAAGTSGEFDVEMMESYKLDVGDDIVVTDTDGTYEGHTIGSIDRESSDIKATVTLNSAVSADFTTANLANVFLKAEDAASGKRSVAKYVVDTIADTGAGEYAEGALGSVVLSNAILRKQVVKGMDATAMTNLGNVYDEYSYYVLR